MTGPATTRRRGAPAAPEFFIVGAPKCGTTALQHYLRQAPDVFMPAGKEFHHFADDLLPPDDPMRDRDHYLSLFAAADPRQLAGETSVFYMLSERAAERIHEFAPGARILVMVRNPLEVIPSLHSQLVYNGDEPLEDLGAALDAEADRSRGVGVPHSVRFGQRLLYSRVVRFAEQIERFHARFDRVHVIVYDDFRRDTEGSFRGVMRFLDRNASFAPELRVVNANKVVRSRRLRQALSDPHGMLARAAHVVPPRLRRIARDALQRWNTAQAARPPLPPDLRARLRETCREEVERLAALLQRDLSHWLGDVERD